MQKNTQFLFMLCAIVTIVSFLLCRRTIGQADINILHNENPEGCTYTAMFPASRSAAVSAYFARELADGKTIFKDKIRLKDGAVFSIRLYQGKLFISAKKAENNSATIAYIHILYETIPQALGQ